MHATARGTDLCPGPRAPMSRMPDDPSPVSPRDIFLARELSEEAAARYLTTVGLRSAAAADQHLQRLADDLPTRLALGELAGPLFDAIEEAPDPDAALVGFCRYVATRTPKKSFIGYLLDDPRALQILTYLLGTSRFLSEILIRNPEYFHWLQRHLDRPAPDLVDYGSELDGFLTGGLSDARKLDALKRFQRREMLRIAGRDLLGKDTLRSTTEQLSNLADTVTEGALRIATAEVSTADNPLPGRFAVIGMGKLGGRELNYSSDVDLIYVYEPADLEDDASDAHARFQKLGRRLTARLGEHTSEGYLYRVDLRLRPLGQRGNLVYSLQQYAEYYESLGETFERFALIKARPIAGDASLGARFIDMVRPFVFRKYLDHAAIEELSRYKARSDREHAKHNEHERNVKVGRGGIREIELFAQVFQLIYGGERPALQTGHTLSALDQLGDEGFIETAVRTDLKEAYEFLRNVEHRLQIVQENQTHSLAANDAELAISARRLGFGAVEELMAQLERYRTRVHEVYVNLLDDGGEDTEFAGRQIFRLLAGEMTDDEAIDRLKGAGLANPESGLQAIRALDAAPAHAHAPSASRNLLANLLATMLAEGSGGTAPTKVLNRFEQVVARSGAAASLYRSLLENSELRERLFLALETGNLFAERLARYPELLDFLVTPTIDPDAFRETVHRAFAEVVEGGNGLEARLDPFRRVKAIEEFKVLVEWLTVGRLETLNDKLSLVAETAVGAAARCIAREQTPAPDTPDAESGWVAIALGKLGGRELTVHSDLDLVFVYAGDPGDATRFASHQRFVRAICDFLARRTAGGAVYELDTRLRPEGKKGALAIPLAAFGRYLQERAEVWERMAWTRGRFVAGDQELSRDVLRAVEAFVYGEWHSDIPGYARHMRSRMERELTQEAAGARLNLKLGRGGLADIDFLLQVLQIREGRARAEFRITGTRQLLTSLPETAFLTLDEVTDLRDAYALLRELETVLRIDADAAVGSISTAVADLEPIGHRLRPAASGADLLSRYRKVTTRVRAIYEAGMTRLGAPEP